MLRELKAQVDELIERDPQTAIALARRIHNKLQPDFPVPLTMLHQQLVAQMMEPPSEELINKTRETLERAGHSKEEIEQLIEKYKQPGLKVGQGFGGLHLEDVTAIAETLWRQGSGKFTIEVEFENPDDDHLRLTIKEIGKAWWQEE